MMLKFNNKGFSLIELMIVVAIIGILASVAVPNFQKFMAKSKQGEAKSNLSAIFTAEKTFFGEWNMYFGDFRDIGFSPEGNLRYAVGFSATDGATLPANYPIAAGPTSVGQGAAAAIIDSVAFCDTNDPAVAFGSDKCVDVKQYAGTAGDIPGAGVTTTTFTIGAAGDLNGDRAAFDLWTMDDAKTVLNTAADL